MSTRKQKSQKDTILGIRVTLTDEAHGQFYNLWLPGGQPQGHFTFESVADFFFIEAYDGDWYAVCTGEAVFTDPSQERKYVTLTDDPTLIMQYHNQRYILFVETMTEAKGVFKNFEVSSCGELTIGRSKSYDIWCNWQWVSGHHPHAVLRRTESGWSLTDEYSKNGTYLNGKLTKHADLKIGDMIYIAGLRIIVGADFFSINIGDRPVSFPTGKLTPMTETEDAGFMPPAVAKYEQEFFNRQPRRRQALPLEPIVIEGPPMAMNGNKMPLLLRMGSSMVMGTTSLLAGHFTTMLSSVLFPVLSQKFTEKERKEYESRRVSAYTQYLTDKKEKLHKESDSEERVLNQNYPELQTVLGFPKNGERLWERQRTDDDFLQVRVGHGNLPMKAELQYPRDRFTIEEDALEKNMRELAEAEHLIKDVPIQTSLIEDFVIGVSGVERERMNFIRNFLLQLVILHSYDEVKVVLLGNEKMMQKLSGVRYLPHLWNDQRSFRFLAENPAEAYQISEYLKRELDADIGKNRRLKDILKTRPYYVVFALDKKVFDSMEILKTVLQEEQSIGVSVIASFDDLPKECSKIFRLGSTGEHAVLYLKQLDHASEKFQLDELGENGHQLVANALKTLANTNLRVVTEAYALPKTITFLEMFGVGKIEHLNILSRWAENNPVKSLAVPVGVATDGALFTLDLHEKFQGPHGLVAGMTGSGKSEFIITYILSLAINFHPDEVAFILIDYKGGGLAGAFDDPQNGVHLPHLVGTITNLDGSGIQRSLVSIQSELTRRQRIFNEVKSRLNEGTMDIYSYQRLYRAGRVVEPMPHLFIISDEFAELKKQQPEFMDQLISIARIGRSLGVHLILATQKPAGVVNDQIRSNTKFRICLKVQDRSDSMDMLKRPEAAEIKETGRFYLQVGYNEFFALGQSAWSGADYEPQETVLREKDESIDFIDSVGQIIQSAKPKVVRKTTGKSQLVEIVQALSALADDLKLARRNLWEEPLPDQLDSAMLAHLLPESSGNSVKECVGLLDDPKNQKQFPLLFDFQKCRNLLVIGEQGSGKTSFFQTSILSLAKRYSPDEVNFYILDYSGRMLNVFAALPHCGAVLREEDANDLDALFELLGSITEERKQLFTELEVESFSSAQALKKLPLIFVYIDNVIGLNSSKKGESYYYKLQDFMKTGYGYGIRYVISCSHLNEVNMRIRQELGGRICLQMKDRYEFGEVLGARCEYVPPQKPGRGLYNYEGNLLEMQLAQCYPKMSDRERIQKIKADVSELLEKYDGYDCAKRFPKMPENETYEEFVKQFRKGRIPLGYSLKNGKAVALPWKQFSLLSLYFGNPLGVRDVLSNFIYAAQMQGAEVTVVKRKKNSIFDEVKKSEDWECDFEKCEWVEPGIKVIEFFFTKLKKSIDARMELLNAYCDENGLNASSEGVCGYTYEYMKKHVPFKMVIFECFADILEDISALTPEEIQMVKKVFQRYFEIARKLNVYYVSCFYSSDSDGLEMQALFKNFQQADLMMMFGGNLHRQQLAKLPNEYSKGDETGAYNRCLVKYRDEYYPVLMPCGELKTLAENEDDINIFK